MGWKQYAVALLLFNALGALAVYVLQRAQLWLPLNPQKFPALSPDSSFNTAVSFITNTNWQGYSGESDHELSHADGRARGAELPVRRHRHRGGDRADPRPRAPQRAHHRQLLGRPDARDAVRAAAAVAGAGARAGIAGGGPELQRLQGRDHGRGADLPAAQDRRRRQPGQGCSRQPGAGDPDDPHADACRWARSPPRRASRSSAPTAAAFSTPTPRTPTRTRLRCRTSWRCWRSC